MDATVEGAKQAGINVGRVVGSYLAGEVTLGGYDAYVGATGEDPIMGSPLSGFERILSFAAIAPIIPPIRFAAVRSGGKMLKVGEVASDAKLTRYIGAEELEKLKTSGRVEKGKLSTSEAGRGRQISAHAGDDMVMAAIEEGPFISTTTNARSGLNGLFEEMALEGGTDAYRVSLREGMVGYDTASLGRNLDGFSASGLEDEFLLSRGYGVDDVETVERFNKESGSWEQMNDLF